MASYCSGADDGDTFLISHLDYLPRLCFRNALSYDGDGVDLKTELGDRQLLNLTSLCGDMWACTQPYFII